MSDNQNLITHLLHVDAPQLTYMVNRMFPFKNQAHTSQNWLDKLYIDYSLQSKASLNINDTVLKKIGLSGALSAAQYGLMQSIPIGTNISLFNYFTLNPQATFQQYTAFQTSEEKYDTSTKTINAFPRNTPKLAFDHKPDYQSIWGFPVPIETHQTNQAPAYPHDWICFSPGYAKRKFEFL